MILYVETSAAAKLLVEEPESARLAARLDKAVDSDDALFSSMLLETELRRLAVRTDLAQTAVTHVLERFDLVEIDRSTGRDELLTRLLAAILPIRPNPLGPERNTLRRATLCTRPRELDMPTRVVRLLRAAVPPSPWNNPLTWSTWRQLLPHVWPPLIPNRAPGAKHWARITPPPWSRPNPLARR